MDIRIQRAHDNDADYINRHFYHSIHVQAICQLRGKFSDVWHFILDLFTILAFGFFPFREPKFSVGEHILGDSGYMLRAYLLTPYQG